MTLVFKSRNILEDYAIIFATFLCFFCLAYSSLNRGKCVDVTGHETVQPDTGSESNQEATQITAQFCLRGKGLNVRLNKPSDAALGGLKFQTPSGARSPMRCNRIMGVLGRNVCKTRFKTATDGDYELHYEGPNGIRTVVFSFTSPGDSPEDRRKAVRVTAGQAVTFGANGQLGPAQVLSPNERLKLCREWYTEMGIKLPDCPE
jgi:hypothetical protein